MKLVECISTRETCPDQIKVGEKYKLDIETIEGDQEGDWYGVIYTMNTNKVGRVKLSHFKSIL